MSHCSVAITQLVIVLPPRRTELDLVTNKSEGHDSDDQVSIQTVEAMSYIDYSRVGRGVFHDFVFSFPRYFVPGQVNLNISPIGVFCGLLIEKIP